MSDFLYSAGQQRSAELSEILTRYLGHVAPEVERAEGDWGSLAVVRGAHDTAHVVMEDDTRLSVVIGEPVVRAGDNSAGTARDETKRREVHAFLREPVPRWDDILDGQYAVLHIDKLSRRAFAITDRFAFIPVFVTTRSDSNETVVGTHVDAVATAAGRDRDIDLVSVADMLATLTCTVPHTLYSGVRQQSPATVARVDDSNQGAGDQFWRPAERSDFATRSDAARMLHDSLLDDVRIATGSSGSAGLLLSGGEDSRAVLGAVRGLARIRAWTFADWKSREVRIASRVAKAYGAKLVIGLRSPSHYTDGLTAISSMIGSHHMFNDVHGYGFHRKLGIEAKPVVFGGLSADSLLKGVYSHRRAVPVKAPPVEGTIRPELLREAEARRATFRRELAEMRPRSADEWVQLWPFAMRKHGGNVDGNRRLFAIHEAYHCNGVLNVAAAAPVEWKLRRRLFAQAVKPFLRRSRFIPHASYYFPAFGPEVNLLMAPGLAVARGVRAVATGQLTARQAPWPTWGSVAKSPAAQKLREAYPLADTPLREAFVADSPEAIDVAVSGWYSLRRLLLLQLAYLASGRR